MADAWKKRSFDLSLALTERLHRLTRGGAHTCTKGDDQYPADTLPILVRGQGCRVWDADGNEFFEYGMGLRAVAQTLNALMRIRGGTFDERVIGGKLR